RRSWPEGAALREGRFRRRYVLALGQARAWRPALSGILPVSPGARGADRAGSFARIRASYHLADALRAAAFAGAAPGLAGSGRPVPLRSPRRPRAPAAEPQPRSVARPRGRAAAGRVSARLRIFRLLGRRC